MERLALTLASFALLAAAAGCLHKPGAQANVPTLVVVDPVDGPAISVLGPATVPRREDDNDGFAVGDRVQIEWQGSWLPATLIGRKGDRWLVRYEAGRDSGESGEEAVERERIRVAVEPPDDETGELDVDP